MQKNAPAGAIDPNSDAALHKHRLPAALVIGSSGTLILGLQPVLLGALLSEARLTFEGLALMATVEMLAIGVGSAAFALLFSARHMRAKAAALLFAAALGNYLTAAAGDPTWLVAIRGVTGLVEGGLIAVAVEMIARSSSPGRDAGWFVIVQTLAQCILAAILAMVIVPRAGAAGGFDVLALTGLVPLVAIPFLSDDYGLLSKSESTMHPSSGFLRPALALLVVFTLYLFIGAIWAFLEPIGGQSGIDAATVGIIVSVTLLVQVAGALSATYLEPRLDYRPVVGGSALLAVLIAAGYALGPPSGVFWLLSVATGFIWLFVVPWQIAMTVEADPSRKTALLVPAAQLFGAALGPAGAAVFIDGGDFRPVAWFAAAAALASLVLLLLLPARSRRIRQA